MTKQFIHPTLTVERKSAYGRSLYYPSDDNAKILAKLTGTETLTEKHLGLIKQLGFDLIVAEGYVEPSKEMAAKGGKARAESINKKKLMAIHKEMKEDNTKRKAELDKKLKSTPVVKMTDIGDLV